MNVRTIAVTVILGIVVATGAFSQNLRNADQPDVDIPDEYEEAVRELVERYEEVRILLREQIELNASLYSESEMEKMTAGLRAQVAALEADLVELTAEYKRAINVAKRAEADALAFKNQLTKVRGALTEEVDTLVSIIDNVEEERLFTLGGGFSQAGYLNALGMFNLPGTNLSMFGQANYEFRTQQNFVSFGVAFQILPQRMVVESWERFRRRMRARNRGKNDAMEMSEQKPEGEPETEAEPEIEANPGVSPESIPDDIPVIP